LKANALQIEELTTPRTLKQKSEAIHGMAKAQSQIMRRIVATFLRF
jgi:hypothetical protein